MHTEEKIFFVLVVSALVFISGGIAFIVSATGLVCGCDRGQPEKIPETIGTEN